MRSRLIGKHYTTPHSIHAVRMDIPAYTSSSAFSREQYALVRKVELAGTPNVADGYILAAADVLRARLLTAGLGIAPVRCFRSH
jgi:hypothetical protein